MRKLGLILIAVSIVLGLLAVNASPVSAAQQWYLWFHAAQGKSDQSQILCLPEDAIDGKGQNDHSQHADDKLLSGPYNNPRCEPDPIPTIVVPTLPTDVVPTDVVPTDVVPTDEVPNEPGVTPTNVPGTSTTPTPGSTPIASTPNASPTAITGVTVVPDGGPNKDNPTCEEIAVMSSEEFEENQSVWNNPTVSNEQESCVEKGYTYTGSEGSEGNFGMLVIAILIGMLGLFLTFKSGKRA